MTDEANETPESIGIRAARTRLRYARQINVVEESVNMHMGGDATVGELVSLMIVMGWKPPGDQAVAGVAPRRASGPIDPEAGFATSGADARWIGDVDAGVYDDAPEEIGILQARVTEGDSRE
jgi:hypothetical protein